MVKIKLSKRFLKSQINSILSTICDFSVTVFLTEIFGCWYLASSATGTFSGGCCNYLLGRHWVFNKNDISHKKMIFKYLMFWSINFSLNVLTVYLLTDIIKLNYLLSKCLVGIIFGVFVNYFLQKKIVYNIQMA